MEQSAGSVGSVKSAAGAAVNAVAHINARVDARAALEATVRACAVVGGMPVGFADQKRGLRLRFLPDGTRADGEPINLIQRVWPDDDDTVVWIERADSADNQARAHFDEALVKGLAASVRIAVDGTSATESPVDHVCVELLVDTSLDENSRSIAAQRLRLDPKGTFSVTVGIGDKRGEPRSYAARIGQFVVSINPSGVTTGPLLRCSATGPLVDLSGVPTSYQKARLAMRFAWADPDEGGPSHVDSNSLGGILALADGCDSPEAIEEAAMLDRLNATHGWAVATLTAIAAQSSLRGAAADLHVHHSTLQSRVELLEHALGYSIVTPLGRTRLIIALALRRLRRNRW